MIILVILIPLIIMCLGCGVWRTPPVNLKQNQELKRKNVGEKSFRLDDLFLHHGKRGGTGIKGIAVSGVDITDPVRDQSKSSQSILRYIMGGHAYSPPGRSRGKIPASDPVPSQSHPYPPSIIGRVSNELDPDHS